ncbi:MAG: hypothetical protein LBN39_08865 [Planctomycetaceae bacterium]|nr:hypothetical protein [Planctomycetaceae bacterium]
MNWFNLPLRTRLGVISAVLLVFAAVLAAQAVNDPVHHRLPSVIKWAALLFVFWLAWKDLEKVPWWVYLAAPPVLVLCLIKPGAWFVVIPALLFVLFVMPKK